MSTAAVKLSVGGETSSQLQAIENTIKRWFRSQEDTLKAIAKSEAMKKRTDGSQCSPSHCHGGWGRTGAAVAAGLDVKRM